MAIGDAGAAAGMTIYPSTDPVSKGYVYANQRADDIAADRTRLNKLEANAKVPDSVSTGSGQQMSIADGKTVAVTQTVTLSKKSYPRTVQVSCGGLVVAETADYADFYAIVNGDTIHRFRVYGKGTAQMSFPYSLPANTAGSFVVQCFSTGGTTVVTSDSNFTYMSVSASTL